MKNLEICAAGVTFREYILIFVEKSMDANGILAKASRAKRSDPSRVYHRRVRAYVRACV